MFKVFKNQKCAMNFKFRKSNMSESVKPHRPDGMRWPFSFGFGRAPQSAAALLLRIRLPGENNFLKAIWGQIAPILGKMSSGSLAKSTPDPVCDGLSDEWDNIEPIREKLREGNQLVPEGTATEGIQSALSISEILKPVLARMELHSKLPEVEPLREEIQKLYVKNKQNRPAADVEADGWIIRKLCSFVKMKCRRVEVSLEPWPIKVRS